MGAARRSALGLGSACTLLVLARGWLVLSLADVFFFGEEQAHGTSAKAMLDDLGVPLYQLIYQYYEGGGLVASALTAPLFALLGPNLLAHKIVALGFDLANLAMGWRLAERWFGFRAAALFALLYVFAPNGAQQMAPLNVGNHYQAIFFFFAIAHLALPLIARERAGPVSLGRCAALGLVAGFGCFFNFLCIPLCGWAALALVCVRPRVLAPRAWAALLASFAIGAIPLWYMWANAGAELWNVHGVKIFDVAGAPPTAVEGENVWRNLLAALPPRGEFQMAAGILLPLLGAAAFRRAPRDARVAFGFLLSFLVVFSAVSVASPFMATYFVHFSAMMRFLPHWGLSALLAGAVLASASASPVAHWRWGARALAAALVVAGATGTYGIAAAGTAPNLRVGLSLLRRVKGYDYPEYLPKLAMHLQGSAIDKLRVMQRFDEPSRDLLYPAAAAAVFPDALDPEWPVLFAALQAADGEHWPEYLTGLGIRYETSLDVSEVLAGLEQLPEIASFRRYYVEGVGRYGGHPTPANIRADLERLREAEAPPAAFFGLGFRVHQCYRLDPLGAAELIAATQKEDNAAAEPLLRGYRHFRRLYSVGG